jgi:hypothetical protein
MPKANHDWLKPRFFEAGRSARKEQNLNSIYLITTRSDCRDNALVRESSVVCKRRRLILSFVS